MNLLTDNHRPVPDPERGFPQLNPPANGIPVEISPPNPGAANPEADVEEPIPPFPLEHLPPTACAMAKAIARAERTPETLAGCCTLGFLSAAIGSGIDVQSGPSRVTRGNLYILASAESGSGKSETYRHAARPFQDYERTLIDCWLADTEPDLQAEKEILKVEINQLKKAVKAVTYSWDRDELQKKLRVKKKYLAEVMEELNAPCLCCEDVTSEKLAVMLAHNQEQLASLSADAGSIVNNLLGRYSSLDRTDESIYLKAFSGDSCRVDRQGREPVRLQRPCLSALWLTQPDKLDTLFGKSELTAGGLIPRLLACHTRARPRPITEGTEGIPEATARAWDTRIVTLIKTFRQTSNPITIEPSPEALKLMNEYHNQIVARRLGDLQDVTTYAARWSEQAWRIGICLHAGRYGAEAHWHELSAATAASAIAIADWFAGEQLRILAAGREAACRAKQNQVLVFLAKHPQGITARDLNRARIAHSAEEARAMLAQLEAEGALTHTEARPAGGGHITLIYTSEGKED